MNFEITLKKKKRADKNEKAYIGCGQSLHHDPWHLVADFVVRTVTYPPITCIPQNSPSVFSYQMGGDKTLKPEKLTGKRAIQGGCIVPCQRRGGTVQEHWLSGN